MSEMPLNSIMSLTDILARLTLSSVGLYREACLMGNIDFCVPNKPTKITTSPELGGGKCQSESQQNRADFYSASMRCAP